MVHVPAQYLGVWQRLSLESAAGTDTASRVFWLQTPALHADIRIPADRPMFACSLHQLTRSELLYLARQQGFAGATLVNGATCQWRRHIDYQPPNGSRDIGRMTFDGERIVEDGLDSSYREVWQRLPDSIGETIALRFMEVGPLDSCAPPRKGYLLTSGDYFMFARDRAAVLPEARTLAGLLADLSREQIIELLDFEISFGRLHGGRVPLEIQLSTLPFREGKAVLAEAEWAEIGGLDGKWEQRTASHQGAISRYWSA